MSETFNIVSHNHKDIFHLGKILTNKDGNTTGVGYPAPGVSTADVATALLMFLLDHADEDVHVEKSSTLDLLDNLREYFYVNKKYGLPGIFPRDR